MERKSEWADETERLFTDLSTRSTVREMEEQRLTLVSIACHPVPRLAQIGQKGTSFTTCGLEETVHCLSSCLCKSRTRQRWSSVWSLGGGRVFLFFISLFASLSLTSSSPRPPESREDAVSLPQSLVHSFDSHASRHTFIIGDISLSLIPHSLREHVSPLHLIISDHL